MFIENGVKTIKIPVIFSGGTVRYYYGGSLPEIEDGTIGELIIPEFHVKDKRFVEISQKNEEDDILSEGDILMAAVDSKNIPEERIESCVKNLNTKSPTSFYFVKIELKEPLRMLYRGSKESKFLNVKCHIPSLDKDAISINNAYSLISREYEPKRASHTGSIYEKCYYHKDGIWYPLDEIRSYFNSRYDARLLLDYKVYSLKDENLNEKILSGTELLLVKYL